MDEKRADVKLKIIGVNSNQTGEHFGKACNVLKLSR
jgi:hypothetical protein